MPSIKPQANDNLICDGTEDLNANEKPIGLRPEETARFLSFTQRIIALNYTGMMNRITQLRSENVAAATTTALIVQGAFEVAQRRIEEQLKLFESGGLPDFITRDMISLARASNFTTNNRRKANDLAAQISETQGWLIGLNWTFLILNTIDGEVIEYEEEEADSSRLLSEEWAISQLSAF